jgi:hypothetical protein
MCFLFAREVPELYARETGEDYRPFRIDSDRFSSWNQVLLEQNPLVLYRRREVPPAEEGGEMQWVFEPAATFNLPPGDSPVRILMYLDREGRTRETVIPDPRGDHGPRRVRAINLAEIPVVVSLNGDTFSLPPRQERIVGPMQSSQTRFTFQFGNRGADRADYISPVLPLRFRHDTHRLTLIFGYRPEFRTDLERNEEITGYRMDALRFFDQAPSTTASGEPPVPVNPAANE